MKKVLFWPYKFKDMKEGWKTQTLWLVEALKDEGYEVLKHKDFLCQGLDCKVYDWRKDTDLDIVVYNHTNVSTLIGNIAKSKRNWFFKPTVPTNRHTTLDLLGYGPYSSITYKKPDFEKYSNEEVKQFFDTKVAGWIKSHDTKWGNTRFRPQVVKEENYYLILGQCAGDSVVTIYDFGGYWTKLEAIVRELLRVGDKQIVIKLHPYTDGKGAANDKYSQEVAKRLRKYGKKVIVYLGMSNVHNFIERANCVFLANSGAGFEVMMHHKPIISWGYPEYHWVAHNLYHLVDVLNAIQLDWFDRDLSDRFLYYYTEKHCFYDLDSCKRRVKEILNERLELI